MKLGLVLSVAALLLPHAAGATTISQSVTLQIAPAAAIQNKKPVGINILLSGVFESVADFSFFVPDESSNFFLIGGLNPCTVSIRVGSKSETSSCANNSNVFGDTYIYPNKKTSVESVAFFFGVELFLDISDYNFDPVNGMILVSSASGESYYKSDINVGNVFAYDNERLSSSSGIGYEYIYAWAPEPGSWIMMLGGFGMVGYAMRHRHRVARRVAG